MPKLTRAEFLSELNERIPDNNTRRITPADHRSVEADLAENAVWHDEIGTAAAEDTTAFAAASHQHAAADVTDLDAATRETIGNTLTAGANVTLTPDGETIRISASGGGGGGGGDMDAATYDPTGISADAFARGNHTGTQAIATVAGLQGALDGKAAAEHTHTLADITDAGSAAAEDSSAFATAAQGGLADSAVQPGDLATVATSGDYGDLANTPALDFAPASHVSDTDNPHEVTAEQVGLGSVDNTADVDKPISTAQMAGLMPVVNHGATASTTRPSGATAVYWIGSVEPTNAQDHDLWHDTGAA